METIVDCRKQEEKEVEVFSSPLEEVMACREKWEEVGEKSTQTAGQACL